MKNMWLLIALTLSLVLPNLTGISSVEAQESDSSGYYANGSSIRWTINEPKNQTYNTVNLNLSVTGETFMAALTNISYSIDDKPRTYVHIVGEKTEDDPITQRRHGTATLPQLSSGVHKITIYIDGWAGIPSKTMPTQKTVIHFEVNVTEPVQDDGYIQGDGVRIYSPLNRTYQPNEKITIKASSPTLGGANIIYVGTYTIDSGVPRKLETESQQIFPWDLFFGGLTGTARLPSLSEGQHKLTVYLKTYIETTAKPPAMSGEATVYFTVGNLDNPEPNIVNEAPESNDPTYGEDITVWSPTNRTYRVGEPIKLEATSKNMDYHLHSASYKLDGAFYKLYNKENQSQARDPAFGTLFGCFTLPKLAEGQHELTVHLQIVGPPRMGDFVDEVTVFFSVGNNTPNITLHSLDGVVFNQSSVTLNFTIDKPVSWMAYCLDNGTQVAIKGNTTITISPGNHTLVVYANDTSGNIGQSSVAHFAVEAPISTLTGNVAGLAAIVSASIAAVVVAFFVVSRHRKPPKHPT